MATNKAKRSNPLAQPRSQRTRRRSNSQPNDTHQKAELFDTLRQLNRGFGMALAALHRLGGSTKKDRRHKSAIFPHDCLHDYRNRAEALRAQANRDLLRLFAGHEDQDALRFQQQGQ